MKKKLLLILCSLALVGCGNKVAATTGVEAVNQLQAGEHDASTKSNTYESDLENAKNTKAGSTKELLGAYNIQTSAGMIADTKYVFSDDTLSIIQTGTYSFADGKITISYGGNETSYDITETTDGFNLTAGDSTLLPLVYMEGTDGLTESELFDGVYSMSNTGYIFSSDGSLDIISTQECSVDKKTVTFAGSEYDWEAKDGMIVLSTNGTEVMTLVP